MKRLLLFFSVVLINILTASEATVQRFVIVTASYNNRNYCTNNIMSILKQNYDNFHLIYIDDCSDDGTADAVEKLVKKLGQEEQVTLIRNTERHYALKNQYDAIHTYCNNTDVVVIVDGDDWFVHADVLTFLNKIYTQYPHIWLTYGQFKEWPSGNIGFCQPMPEEVIKHNRFRDHVHIPSHLRTFKAGLFKKIKQEDLMYEGKFFQMTGDIAAMFPMIEMARNGHFVFIPQVLLIYNAANTLNDHKVSKRLQRDLDLYIRSNQRYPALDTLE